MTLLPLPDDIFFVILKQRLGIRVSIAQHNVNNCDIFRDMSITWSKNNETLTIVNGPSSQRPMMNIPGVMINLDAIRRNGFLMPHLYHRLLPGFITSINNAYCATVCKKWYSFWKESPIWKALLNAINADMCASKIATLVHPKNQFVKSEDIRQCFVDVNDDCNNADIDGNQGSLPFNRLCNKLTSLCDLKRVPQATRAVKTPATRASTKKKNTPVVAKKRKRVTPATTKSVKKAKK